VQKVRDERDALETAFEQYQLSERDTARVGTTQRSM
jgi:hypothetical protein